MKRQSVFSGKIRKISLIYRLLNLPRDLLRLNKNKFTGLPGIAEKKVLTVLNSIDPDQTAHKEQSDHGLYCRL